MREKESDQRVDHYYGQISPEIRRSFNQGQKDEIRKLIRRMIPKPAKKMVDVRFTFWFIKRMFAVIFIGISKRKKERKSDLKGLQKFLAFEFKIAFYIIETAVLLLLLLMVLYILKITFGINILAGIF